MRGFAGDLRHALRLAGRSPGFTLVALLTIAVGIGASTAVFGLLDALLLRPLPYDDPDRLVVPTLTVARNGDPPHPTSVWSYPKYLTFLENQDLFESVGGFRDIDVNLIGGATPERLSGELVTPSYFTVLGIHPVIGRGFGKDSESPAGAQIVVVGDHLWRQRFGGDLSLVGRTLHADGIALTVVGIAPPGFRGLTGTADIWVPMAMAPRMLHPQMLEMRWSHWFEVVGRLRPGVARDSIAPRMASLGAIIDAAHPSKSASDKWGASARSLVETRQDPKLRTSVLVLFGAVALVLLMGCVNVAHLLLSRAAARRNELAVRAALGATRGRLVRQLLTESLLLGVAGGALGLLLAVWGLELFAALRPEAVEGTGVSAAELTDLDAIGLSPMVAAFAFATSLVAGLISGALPAYTTSRVDLATRMKETSTTLAAPLRGRGIFAAVELALALVLLVGAGLLLRTLRTVTAVDLGYQPGDVLSFEIDPLRPGPETPWPRREELLARLAALPGIGSVAFDICVPPLGRCDETEVTQIEGKEPFSDGAAPPIGVHFVSPDYFRTLGIPVVRGRGLGSSDRDGAPQVILVNQAAARMLFADGEAIGHRIHAAYGGEGMAEIVGVVGDARHDGPVEPPHPAVYVPMLQTHHSSGYVFVRSHLGTESLAEQVRRTMRAIDPDVPVFSVRTLVERTREATARPRFAALVLGGFAAVALLLAAIGVYGVMASTVAQRRREIGIRMALGARGFEVLLLVIRQGATIALAGVAVGVVLAVIASRVLSGMVYGVSVTDLATYVTVASLLFIVALAACLLAARRAVSVDPAETLREA